MHRFDTPAPISIRIDVPVGDVWIKASDRSDTVASVRPSNESSKSDVSAAEQTRVEYADGYLAIKAPKSWRRYGFFGAGPSVDVVVEVPTGSQVHADANWTSFRAEGALGACQFNTGGTITLARASTLDVDTSYGDVTVEHIAGRARLTTGYGQVRVRSIEGPAVVKNSGGSCWIGEASGEVRVNTASGDITIDRALADVAARTAYGAIRIGEAVRGSLELHTSYGGIDVGVRDGTAAWLDVGSLKGRVRNSLDATDGPAEAEETIEIRANTSYGDITIRRS